MSDASPEFPLVSVVIPARDEAVRIATIVGAVRREARPGTIVEIIVVDDGSTDFTAALAARAGARIFNAAPPGASGNPARARNLGAAKSAGDPIVFLDSDCIPQAGWLDALLSAHAAGHAVVGGAIDLPPGLRWTARCDYYAGWYFVHSRRAAGIVPHHPPPNLSVRRAVFQATTRFREKTPLEYTNEERHWQGEVRKAGGSIYFEPRARVHHYNRPGLVSLLRRHYRWAYSGIEAKSESRAARLWWIYRFPWLLFLMSGPLVFVHTACILFAWLKAGVFEALLATPWILLSRVTYVAGLVVGGFRYLNRRDSQTTVPASPDPAIPADGSPALIRVSVAICTHRRPTHLERALWSIVDQKVPADEIVVIDNGSQRDSETVKVCERFPGVRYLNEQTCGLDFARNRALLECSHDVVAFVDDDVVVTSTWVEMIREAFAENRLALGVTGKVDALTLDTEGQRVFEKNGGFARGDERIRLPSDARRRRIHGLRAPLIAWAISVGSGCSLAVRRTKVLELGGFDEALDLGGELPGGGDLDMLWRILDSRFELIYEPRVHAFHEHRPTKDAAIRQIIGHQYALIAFLVKAWRRGRGFRRITIGSFLCWRLLKPGLRWPASLCGIDPLPASAVLRLWLACWRGLGAYDHGLRIAGERRAAAGIGEATGSPEGIVLTGRERP